MKQDEPRIKGNTLSMVIAPPNICANGLFDSANDYPVDNPNTPRAQIASRANAYGKVIITSWSIVSSIISHPFLLSILNHPYQVCIVDLRGL